MHIILGSFIEFLDVRFVAPEELPTEQNLKPTTLTTIDSDLCAMTDHPGTNAVTWPLKLNNSGDF